MNPVRFRSCVFGLIAFTSFAGAARAQSSDAWRLYAKFGVEAEYNDNVFLLSPLRKADLAAPTSGAVASGRFTDMESTDDLITTASAAVGFRGPGLLGRRLQIVPSVSYEYFAQNQERRHVAGAITIRQSLPNGARLQLTGKWKPSYFAKNYLVDAVDADGSGSISSSERVYARGTYDKGGVWLDYRFPLVSSTKRQPFGARLEIGGGYERRTYDAPFAGRDRDGPTVRASLPLSLTKRLGLEIGYSFASPSTAPSQEILLLDERSFGVDLNGNGVATDSLARASTLVDRSRQEHVLGAALSVGLGRRVELAVDYGVRWRRYSSKEAFDVTHTGRRDLRHRARVELDARLAHGLALELKASYADQNSNRPGDPGSTGEIDDYTRRGASLGLSYRP
ncbi:MAG: hypothetical protein ACE5HF_01445 [Gemmatimonadota bacterium]